MENLDQIQTQGNINAGLGMCWLVWECGGNTGTGFGLGTHGKGQLWYWTIRISWFWVHH